MTESQESDLSLEVLPFIADHLTSETVELASDSSDEEAESSSDSEDDDGAACEREERLINRMAERNAAWHAWPGYTNQVRPCRKRPRSEDRQEEQHQFHNARWSSPCETCISEAKGKEIMEEVAERVPWLDVKQLSDFHKALIRRHYDCALGLRNQGLGGRERYSLDLAAGGVTELDAFSVLPQMGHGVKNRKQGERLLEMALKKVTDAKKLDDIVKTLIQLGAVPTSCTVYLAARKSLHSVGVELIWNLAIAESGYPSRVSEEVEDAVFEKIGATVDGLSPVAVLNDDPTALRCLARLNTVDFRDTVDHPRVVASAPLYPQVFYFLSRDHGSAIVEAVPRMLSKLLAATDALRSVIPPKPVGTALLLKMEATRGLDGLV